MKRRGKFTRNPGPKHRLDTVGVAGSIPVEPTIHKLKQKSHLIEIPEDYDVIPAVEWNDQTPRLFRVLIKKSKKRIKRGSNDQKGVA